MKSIDLKTISTQEKMKSTDLKSISIQKKMKLINPKAILIPEKMELIHLRVKYFQMDRNQIKFQSTLKE